VVIQLDAYRQRAKEYGSAWTVFVRVGLAFVELNIGRDRKMTPVGYPSRWRGSRDR